MDGFTLAIVIIVAAGIGALGAYGAFVTSAYDEGFNDGCRLGCLISEFNALCALTGHDMDEGGDAE